MKKPRFLGALALALTVVDGSVVAQHKTKSTTHTVSIKGFEFAPKQLKVRTGDTVIWTNEDIVPHTATAKNGFDSKEIASKKSWTYKVTRKGKFLYTCTYHPTMRGELIVE